MRKILFLLLFLSTNIAAKNFRIVDSVSNYPLVFASVEYYNEKLCGKISDIDGQFSIDTQNTHYLKISHTGYEAKKISRDKLLTDSILRLKKLNTKETISSTKSNAAHIIMDSVRANIEKNNPYNLSRFSSIEYVKSRTSYLFNKNNIDSNKRELADFFEDSDLLVSENIYQRNYRKSSGTKLILRATHSSGFHKKAMYIPVDDFQPFHFYDKNILILNVNYFNPIYDDNYSSYQFQLLDSIKTKNGFSYRISFKPIWEFAENVLRGEFLIDKENYALHTVVAHTDKIRKLHGTIEQKYAKLNEVWFPTQHGYLLKTEKLSTGASIAYKGKTYAIDFKLQDNPSIDYNSQYLEHDPNLVLNDSAYFAINRPVPINFIEQNTFLKIDTTLRHHDLELDKLPVYLEKFGQGMFPLNKLDLELFQLYNNNSVEGNRVGLGLYTNEELTDRASFGGYLAYGFKDKNYKYGLKLGVNLNKKYFWKLNFNYVDDFKLSKEKRILKDFIVYDYTRYEEFKISSSFSYHFFDLNLFLSKQNIDPYKRLSGEPSYYRVAELGFNCSFDLNKKYLPSWVNQYDRQNISNPKAERVIPKINISITEAINGMLDGQYSYTKLKLSLENKLVISELGRFHSKIDMGLIDRNISYAKLFSGNNIFAKESFMYFKNTFQTIRANEFSNSKFIHGFFRFRFLPLPLSSKYSKPFVSLAHNIGYGELETQVKKNNPLLIDMSKIYLESGIVITDIIRYPLFNLIYIGSGFSTFIRWGDYADDKLKKNLNVKFDFRLAF